MDNASNNDTCMEALEQELVSRDIHFDRQQNRIQCAFLILKYSIIISKLTLLLAASLTLSILHVRRYSKLLLTWSMLPKLQKTLSLVQLSPNLFVRQ